MIPWIFFCLAVTAALAALITELLGRRGAAHAALAFSFALAATGARLGHESAFGAAFLIADIAFAVLAGLAVGKHRRPAPDGPEGGE